MLFNPFQPNSMIRPDMFVGRQEELDTIERCLFQTENGNPQHFLIEGERGIGKSSTLLYVDYLARGKVSPILQEKTFNFLCVSVDLGKCDSQLQIIQTIGRGLKQEIGKSEKAKEMAKGFWDWITNWEVMGTKYNKKGEELDPEMAAQDMVVNISSFLSATDYIEGLLILLDEADSPDASANLGSFLKLTAERLQREGCNNVLFGIAGLPSLLPKLMASHESSPRLFEILKLMPLTLSEREQVIKRAIARANEKNDKQIAFDEMGLDELCHLSEGYPHFLQQFAYCAFEANKDEEIDVGDVWDGAFAENGAIDQLGGKFFHDMYHARIASDDYRTVLNTMAPYGDEWVKKDDILTESGLKDHTVKNALSSLKTKNIIIHDSSRRGYYRLPNRSFSVWINATKRKSEARAAPSHQTI